MIVQLYLNKIEVLQDEESKTAFSDFDDLELCTQKIKGHNSDLSFTLDFLLNKQTQESTTVNTEVIKMFSDHLGLFFIGDQESENVCFANSIEVRPEYRQSFRLIDLLDYIYAFAHSYVFKESQKIMLTSETDSFWKLVKIGSRLRKAQLPDI
ncbi:hypothetical protein [uncultured Flavobacterium sp.]|uniref:hypothetical protein n=2 Tax=Flavobacterium TaxID=237 RepID=UPI002598F130|nr:hypothetical protein [uncultured Flavobacterium sp.]